MAISNNIENKEPASQAESASKAFGKTQADSPITQRSWGLSSPTMFGAPIGRGVGSEYVTKLVAALTEAYKDASESGYDITVMTVDNQQYPALAFSFIMVCVNQRIDKASKEEKVVAAHILLVEATGDKISPVIENINGVQVEIMRTPSDALDKVLYAIAAERLSKGFPGYRTIISDGEVIPVTFDLEDKGALHSLAANAAAAAGTDVVMNNSQFQDLDLRTEKSGNLYINLDFNKLQLKNAVGAPVRSDVIISFSSKKNTQGRNFSVNTNDRENKISEISGFVDVLYNPQNTGNMYNPYYANPQQPISTQMYSPRFVMTDVHSQIAATPASILLALSTAAALAKDLNWVLAFRPVMTGNNIDINDIGALNLEANLAREPQGQINKIDTKSDKFTPQQLGEYISAIIRPGLIIAMDCPEGGPQSWYLNVFAAASAGVQKAVEIVVAAANTLTGGNFSKYMTNNDTLFIDTENRVLMGYWFNKNGEKRDLRDFDLIAAANLVGGKNPRAIADFSDLTLNQAKPLPIRLQDQKRMLMALSNETAVFTGFAQRITLSSAFLNALSLGIRDAGISVTVNTPLPSSDFQNQRGTATALAQAAQFIPNQSFMNNSGFNQSGYVYAGPNNQFGNRFGG